MPDTLTLAQLNAMTPEEADHALRVEVKRVLEPGPWRHDNMRWDAVLNRYVVVAPCRRCNQGGDPPKSYTCEVPPEAQGSWADLAERLREKLVSLGHAKACRKLSHALRLTGHGMSWYASETTARERVICLLIAIGAIV